MRRERESVERLRHSMNLMNGTKFSDRSIMSIPLSQTPASPYQTDDVFEKRMLLQDFITWAKISFFRSKNVVFLGYSWWTLAPCGSPSVLISSISDSFACFLLPPLTAASVSVSSMRFLS